LAAVDFFRGLFSYIFALFFGWGKRQLQQSTHIKNSIKKMSVAKLHYAFYIFEPHTHTHTQKTKTKPIFLGSLKVNICILVVVFLDLFFI